MTDSKKSERHSEPSAGKTMVRLSLDVMVPVDLPSGCEVARVGDDDPRGLPTTAEALVSILEAVKASQAHRDAISALVGCKAYLADQHPAFVAVISELPDFTPTQIMDFLNGRS